MDEADEGERPSLWQRFRALLQTLGGLLVELTGALALIVFVIVIGTLGYEQIKFWINGPDADALTRRDFLCTEHAIDRPDNDADALDIIAYDISLLKEKARAFAQPNDPVGRIESFIVCATVSGVSTSGVDLQLGGAQSQLAGLPAAELITLEREEIALIKELFPEVPARIIEKIENKLAAALSIQIERQREAEADDRPLLGSGQGSVPNPNPEPELSVELQPLFAVPTEDAEWIMIVGADKSPRSAADQVRQTRRLLDGQVQGVENIGLYQVRDWQRTVIPFATRGEAEEAESRFVNTLNYGAYIKNIWEFCNVAPPTFVETWTDETGKSDLQVPVYLCSE